MDRSERAAYAALELNGQMQRDYMKRKKARQSASSSTSHVNGHGHHLPRRVATLPSVQDSSGAAVVGERVILYIHGEA